MTIHIAGLDVQVGTRLRQRCAWCSELLEDRDLAREKVAVTDQSPVTDETPVRGWPVGGLVDVTSTPSGAGRMTFVVPHRDGDKLPPDCCANLDEEMTHG